MKDLLGDEFDSFIREYENSNDQALRFNPLKKGFQTERETDYLSALGIAKQAERDPDREESPPEGKASPRRVPWEEHAWYYEESESVRPGRHMFHELGLYYIQEPSAMSAAALLDPRPKERVLDLCAAPGGKSGQLASRMRQEGVLVCNEIHPQRCRILSSNIERMGIANAMVLNEDALALPERFPEYFDRILTDAPCSGEGMFRKNPEAVKEWSKDHVIMCAARQQKILDAAAGMLKQGGTLVYSTCTFSPEENEQVISRFLLEHKDFYIPDVRSEWFAAGRTDWADSGKDLDRTFRLWPHRLHGEGHYAAVLKKKAAEGMVTEPGAKKKKKSGNTQDQPDRSQRKLLDEFLSETVCEQTGKFLTEGRLLLFGDQLYRLPGELAGLNLKGMKIERPGLALGTFRKNRFEPSHALALWLGREEVRICLDLKPEEEAARAWFRGEALNAQLPRGWCLVCIDGFSAGWGKSDGRTVKNHYPKGLRKLFDNY